MKDLFYSYGASRVFGNNEDEVAEFFYSALQMDYPEAAQWWEENYPSDGEGYSDVRPEGEVFEMCEDAYSEIATTVVRCLGLKY